MLSGELTPLSTLAGMAAKVFSSVATLMLAELPTEWEPR